MGVGDAMFGTPVPRRTSTDEGEFRVPNRPSAAAADPLKLRKSDAVRALNSTPLGTVTSARQLDRYAQAGGWLVGDGKTVHLVRLTAWLAHERHHPREPQSYEEHRERMGLRARQQSAEGREIGALPAVDNAVRRARAATDFQFFCEAYFPLTFHLPWSKDHLKVIAKIEQAVMRGGLFAMAMPRGSGKSTICECACIWAVLYGHREFVCLIGSDEGHAMDRRGG
uniref:Uncharacterized protein n=1 Tax=Schlesneria paludicola TaxID=360056 RepID=A0A7C4LLG1_9PLAN